jgi:hypothetical protein
VPHLLVGALVNAWAVAEAVARIVADADRHSEGAGGRPLSVTVLACGERWKQPNEDGELRFAIEDYLGAGAILAALPSRLSRSPEALVCQGAFLAARDDLAQEGWVYAGGSYALPGETVHFVVELTAGSWQIGATRESVPPDGEEVVEWGTLTPLTVTEAATPIASPAAEPEVAATVELQDVAFGGLEGPLPAGPQIWKVTNTGQQPRQVVLWRTPELVEAADWQGILAPMMGGTPSPDVPSFDQMVWVGYVAILSPGQTVWIEFDLAPGFYSATSWVLDPATGTPAILLGMAQGFEVQ